MNICLVGWGVETKSAYRFFGNEHNYLIVSEEPRDDFPTGDNITIQTLATERKPGLTSTVDDLSYLDGIENAEQIIYTPTSRKNLEEHFGEDHPLWEKALSSLHYFFENSPSKNIIGVTGTKGKGTTTTLISEMLEAAGKTVHTGGNIGVPVLDILPHINQDDWVVLELSSFQLYKFPHSPHIAVHLMMIPEHIEEWHKTMDDYVDSKKNLFAHQSEEDIAVYFPDNEYSAQNVEASRGKKIPYCHEPGAYVKDGHITIDKKEIIQVNEVGLLGDHNLQNICAAVTAAWQVSQDSESFSRVLREFTGLEHRLQFVRELDGIRYYDDSFGTTPDTAIVACDAFAAPKVVIVGGHDKGNDYSGLAKRLCDYDIHHVVFIGNTGQKLLDMARSEGFNDDKASIREDGNSWDMREIVGDARFHSRPGDVVLLSTGSASFGLFADYKDRGDQFIAEVNKL